MALKTDALESLVNILASFFALFSLIFGKRPADSNHPYGHGKIEFFSSFFEGGLILLASILIIYESIEKFIIGIQLKEISYGIWINFIAGSMNGVLGFILIKKGKYYNSTAIESDGYHLISDFYTTISIFVGLIIVELTGFLWLDSLIAGIMGLWLFYVGLKIIFRSLSLLLDTENPDIIKKIVQTINEINNENIITVHATRTLCSGNYFHIDIHFVLPEFFTIKEANTFIHDYEIKIIKKSNIKGEFHSHFDPCKKLYCKICRKKNCPIRVEPFENYQPLTYEQAISWPKEDKDRLLIINK